MSDRVLSSQAAKDAIQKIQSIITGGLTRNETWPHTHQSLQKASQDLTELNKQLQKIANDIFQAGGGA